MIRKILILLFTLSLLMLLSGCGKQCKKARNQIIKPTNIVLNYLASDPSGETLANSGCSMILKQFKDIPKGANVIRKLADSRFTHTNARCLYWNTGYHYRCYPRHYATGRPPYHPPHHNQPSCYYEPYRYCGQWQYDTVQEPGYAQAIEFSQELDEMYAKTHHMCGQAAAGNQPEAYDESRSLLYFLRTEVKPDGDTVYAMACGR